ncbi:MAG: Mitochondrial outer membrane protein iml2 [Trizodia sp. TS-e1964]|nr:MAG: Mitochondrial outer membrane protein iml2 [Trizodia sp. TS-e1964]
MLKVGAWLSAKPKLASPLSLNYQEEQQHLEDALQAASMIMDDDIEGAEASLAKGNSTFHKLGQGITTFMRATLGFEQDIMKEASDRLADAELNAASDQRRAIQNPESRHSSIYPPGTEYALCQAQAQLMGAVVCVLSESFTESLKGFYKLRKAYITLNSILEAEGNYMKERALASHTNSARSSLEPDPSPLSSQDYEKAPVEPLNPLAPPPLISVPTNPKLNQMEAETPIPIRVFKEPEIEEQDEFFDADETNDEAKLQNSYLETEEKNEKSILGISQSPQPLLSPASHLPPNISLEADILKDPIDTFIHTGTNVYFGLLVLMLSIIPPALSKLLYIIGFKGDRDKGLVMLWQASKVHNINGGMAGLVLLAFYNGFVGFSDILPEGSDSLVGSHRQEMCGELLAEMRRRYPQSKLWLLEEARMEACNKRLEEAIEILSRDDRSPLKQVEALSMFEKSLNAMYSLEYELCYESFMKCAELNSWSHALYYYIAASAQVECYRQYRGSDPIKAAKHAALAEKLYRKVPGLTGKKFMARQLPFDIFVRRKVEKFLHRSQEWGVDFIDAIGVSPLQEMIYLWNGYKRMPVHKLEKSLELLAWSEATNPHWHRESLDEYAILALLRAVTLRSLLRFTDARAVLEKDILVHDRGAFKGHLRDEWTCPSAHYEMAVICWQEGGAGGGRTEAQLRECREWLDKVAKWESYDLDSRVGVKIATAQDTLKQLEKA